MSDISKKTFKDLSLPYFKEVYELIDRVCHQYAIPFYLIGAQARDINLLESNISPVRGTMDIDFAIMFPDIEMYDRIREELTRYGFEKVSEPYRMIHRKTDTVVDILPFGQIEQNGTVRFTEREIEISVVGFNEVYQSVREIQIEDIALKVTPLSGIVVLKLISWNEKPGNRMKDIDDILFILKNYFTIYQDLFYQEHLDCIDEIDELNFELLAGARMLGRHMGTVLKVSDELKDLILKIIENRLAGKVGQLSTYSDVDFELLDNFVITHLKKGIGECL